MNQRHNQSFGQPTRRDARLGQGGPFAEQLLHVVDAGLVGVICVAPFVFGGRHDLGRLVFVLFVAVTASAWFIRQSLLPAARWTRTAAHGILLFATALLVLQLVPLPADWITRLAPNMAELLPLWTPGSATADLGTWKTLSFVPHETTLSLAMLLSYGLLFVVLSQRIQNTEDVEKMLNTVAVAAVLMAGFGLVQFFASNGQFFWCYVHPFRTTDHHAMGSFMNRNHFASFLVLGVGPLARWLIVTLRRNPTNATRWQPLSVDSAYIPAMLLIGALTITLLAIVLSMSRGGAIALVAAAALLGVIYMRWRLVDVKYFYGLAGLALALLGLLSVYGYDQVAGRYSTLAEGSIEAVDEGEGRREIWEANASAIQHGWLSGYGAGSHREITPVYLTKSSTKQYTHAENGYLQIFTENGIVGAALLLSALALCGTWCIACLGRLASDAEQLCLGAAAAGLAATVVHSVVDFVWYIPACMSVTIVLAVCILRLSQFASPEAARPGSEWLLSRPCWLELAASVVLLGGWSVYTFFGPAVASIHWDRYLRAKVADGKLSRQQLSAFTLNRPTDGFANPEPLSDVMLMHLERVVAWDPAFARARLELAAKYVSRFELLQQRGENLMPLRDIGNAVRASNFGSANELHAWMNRAFGENAELLYLAHNHARRAARLSPLQGKAYVLMATLSFLEGIEPSVVDAYVDQGLLLRPVDGELLFNVGMYRLYKDGHAAAAREYWMKCFGDTGPHQLRIVQLIAGRIPAQVFIEDFQPDWRTLRQVWSRYQEVGRPEDSIVLVDYAAEVTKRQVEEGCGIPSAYLWLWQAGMYQGVDRPEDALACLENAYRSGSHVYGAREALGEALMKAGRFQEAEPHFRWCLARRPENKWLSAGLIEITKQRIAQRDGDGASTRQSGESWRH